MAELLIKAKNHTHADPEKDRRGAYKKGMIIHVVEDGYPWGKLESKQAFIAAGNDAADWHNKTVIVKITGVTVDKVNSLRQEQDTDDTGAPMPTNEDGSPQTYRRRAWQLLIDNVPAGIKATLQVDGEVTVTKLQIRNFLKRIRDNAQYTDID